MNTVVVLLVGVAVVVAAIAAVSLLRPRPKVGSAPECTLEAAWNHYVENSRQWSSRDHLAIERCARGDREAAEKLRETLSGTVDNALSAADPLVVLRLAIMDATDRFVTAEALYGAEDSGGDKPETRAEADYLPSVVEAGVLRCFSMLRFEDFGKQDWYSHYLKMAEMNSKNVAGMVRKTVRGESSSIEVALHDPLMDTMREVRNVLLHHPPRTPVDRDDRLAHREAPAQPYPSQQQIDRLTAIMSERFEKLFSGMVYQPGAGATLDLAGAFQVDAGLLYTLLAVNFRHPTEGWRQIMDKSLGRHRDAMQNEEKLLEIGRECHRVWLKNAQEGPLNAALQTSCRIAFEGPEAALASSMIEDAGLLVGAIQRVVVQDPPGWKTT
jgi:hypothetical protein